MRSPRITRAARLRSEHIWAGRDRRSLLFDDVPIYIVCSGGYEESPSAVAPVVCPNALLGLRSAQ